MTASLEQPLITNPENSTGNHQVTSEIKSGQNCYLSQYLKFMGYPEHQIQDIMSVSPISPHKLLFLSYQLASQIGIGLFLSSGFAIKTGLGLYSQMKSPIQKNIAKTPITAFSLISFAANFYLNPPACDIVKRFNWLDKETYLIYKISSAALISLWFLLLSPLGLRFIETEYELINDTWHINLSDYRIYLDVINFARTLQMAIGMTAFSLTLFETLLKYFTDKTSTSWEYKTLRIIGLYAIAGSAGTFIGDPICEEASDLATIASPWNKKSILPTSTSHVMFSNIWISRLICFSAFASMYGESVNNNCSRIYKGFKAIKAMQETETTQCNTIQSIIIKVLGCCQLSDTHHIHAATTIITVAMAISTLTPLVIDSTKGQSNITTTIIGLFLSSISGILINSSQGMHNGIYTIIENRHRHKKSYMAALLLINFASFLSIPVVEITTILLAVYACPSQNFRLPFYAINDDDNKSDNENRITTGPANLSINKMSESESENEIREITSVSSEGENSFGEQISPSPKGVGPQARNSAVQGDLLSINTTP